MINHQTEMAPQKPTIQNSPLTARETEVVRLIAEGLTTKEIADRLGIAFKTAVCHRSHVANKLGTSKTALLTRYAIRVGLIEP